MDSEIDVLRFKLGRVLDLLHAKLGAGQVEPRLMIENKVTRTVSNTAFMTALSAIYGRLKVLAPRSADVIFDEEVRMSAVRRKPLVDLEREAKEATRFLIPFASVRQEAVGHGGFHTGVLGFATPGFRWVYDCGSWRKKSMLSSRVKAFLARSRADLHAPDIDALFVSHFDADHVNGLETLFEGSVGVPTSVKMVVAPYLSPREVVATIGRAAAAGRDSGNLIRAAADPAGYFGDKGVETLVLIRPDGPLPPTGEGAGGLPVLPTPHPPDRDGLTLEFFDVNGKPVQINPPEAGKINVIVADPGSFFEMTSYGRALDWIFLPHAHEWRFNREKIAAECRRLLKLDPDDPSFNRALVDKLRTRVGLKSVKKLYCGMNSNGTSMSLYAGPRTSDSDRVVYGKKVRSSGWLLTGDAPLNRKDAFAQWRGSFAPVASLVGRLMLPHHGAERNFNEELTTYASKATPFLTVDRADYVGLKRPPRRVRTALDDRFVAVTEKRLLAEVSGPSSGKAQVSEVEKW
ncbi:MBL fold metallo-hydrolase [Bradyrhizobium erythrophlei]|jgi:glyoxylase-like metal-dependent hydrolase (beta-lactamase superfamily II)|uniref:Metallo-beta-lactamase domain-containing protein n=1 Tax=Bradyrhizobium erythrophlei TaxID=1437360 RepID=A0A1M5STX7_9BRAD|nr:MBL fold metallo-hydrolase [Bradyrhizobium erythrophlei]SHH42001.1 hypothetical protein SAMN05444169_7372 [Bradyrhizobium erythrophlei]